MHVETRNPCTCEHCRMGRIYHWRCDNCDAGPFRFQQQDPGPQQARRPFFTRTLQAYDADSKRWLSWARYCCGRQCFEAEQQHITDDLLRNAAERPDLAESLAARVHGGRAAAVGADDLGAGDVGVPSDRSGGAYVPSGDDLV